jgi:cysteinyl-tRNA synthetase
VLTPTGGVEPANPLQQVTSWSIQLQGIEATDSVDALVASQVDMLVLEPTRLVRGEEWFPTGGLVQRVRQSPGVTRGRKLCIAYLNVGQAEDYRPYWQPSWRPPTATTAGEPAFLVTVDPDGWAGNYPVAFWDPRWREILWGRPESLLDAILADGFDGVYLDWILAYQEPAVVAAARRAGVEPDRAMADQVRELRAYARRTRPAFVVIAQNGVDLGEAVPEYYRSIDGIAHEDLSFRGSAAAKWDDPASGDVAIPATGGWSTAQIAAGLRRFRERGLPVFTLDYALDPTNIQLASERSRQFGFVPCVTRTPLDRLPAHATPPR